MKESTVSNLAALWQYLDTPFGKKKKKWLATNLNIFCVPGVFGDNMSKHHPFYSNCSEQELSAAKPLPLPRFCSQTLSTFQMSNACAKQKNAIELTLAIFTIPTADSQRGCVSEWDGYIPERR